MFSIRFFLFCLKLIGKYLSALYPIIIIVIQINIEQTKKIDIIVKLVFNLGLILRVNLLKFITIKT